MARRNTKKRQWKTQYSSPTEAKEQTTWELKYLNIILNKNEDDITFPWTI